MKKLLILGGTRQIGRRLIEFLLENENDEYDISIFNRGQTNPSLFPSVKRIVGDRKTADIRQIFQQDWDIVLDCACYEPFSLQEISNGLTGKVGRYILISSISVYENNLQTTDLQTISETFSLKNYTAEQLQMPGLQHYAEKKVAAEQVLLESNIEDKVILRPHFIYGKYDYQNLDYYWLDRIRKHTQILLPNNGNDLIQRTYLEDLVAVLVHFFKTPSHNCIYNATTEEPFSLKNYLDLMVELLQKEINFVSISNQVLVENKIRPVYDLPFWNNGLCAAYTNQKLRNDSQLTFTPLQNSMQTLLHLDNPNTHWVQGKLGLDRTKEERLIF